MVDTQLGRRNLTSMQKIEIAEKYRPVYEKKAEERMLSGKADPMQKSSQGLTRDALANLAGVSHDTYAKAKRILKLEEDEGDKLTPAQKEYIAKARSGEMKINTVYNKLFKSDSTGNKSSSKGTKSKRPVNR